MGHGCTYLYARKIMQHVNCVLHQSDLNASFKRLQSCEAGLEEGKRNSTTEPVMGRHCSHRHTVFAVNCLLWSRSAECVSS